MKLGSRRTIPGAAAIAAAWLLATALTHGQAGQSDKPLMAEDVFKNVQVLKGISVNEFMGTMGIFSASLGMSCEDCHAADDRKWENFAVDNARKRMARKMITMMAAINKEQFGGRQMVTCFACHRGADKPKSTPDLAAMYGAAPPDPSDVITQAPGAPSADAVLDKYVQALGGAERVNALTSIVATGKAVGYGPESAEDRPVEIYAKAPAQRTTIIHTGNGNSTTTYDGRSAWVSAPLRPVPVLALAGQDLEAMKLDAELSFPGRIKQTLNGLRVGILTTINDRDVQVVQGTSAGGVLTTLYLDDQSGLLARMVRYTDSPVGRLISQTDYADYRDVGGVKMPYHLTLTWLDGRENLQLNDVRTNAPVDPARFAKPGPPVAPAPRR